MCLGAQYWCAWGQDMQARGEWGHIINISGLSGSSVDLASGETTIYAATKHAVRALTEGLRQEARQKGVPLRVSNIAPGAVDTSFFGGANTGRSLAPKLLAQDVVQTILWCLSAPAHVDVSDVTVRGL